MLKLVAFFTYVYNFHFFWSGLDFFVGLIRLFSIDVTAVFNGDRGKLVASTLRLSVPA